MKFMIQSQSRDTNFAKVPHRRIRELRARLHSAKSETEPGQPGHIIGSYSIIGGGHLWIVESSSTSSLNRRLHELGIFGVVVTPIAELEDVLEEYDQWHQEHPGRSPADY